jgi:hypothetical protein
MDYGYETLAYGIRGVVREIKPSISVFDVVRGGPGSGTNVGSGLPVPPGEGGVSLAAAGSQAKVLCAKCGFLVRPEGHESRCAPGGQGSGIPKFVPAAWVGDAVHTLDVRRVLVSRVMDPAARHNAYISYVKGEEMARYYLDLVDKPEEVIKTQGKLPSTHNLATMFEAHYRGAFRENYLIATFGLTGAEVNAMSSVEVLTDTKSSVDSGAAPRIYAVIMPPGHGKSFRHGRDRLREADVLFSHKGSPLLVELKKSAQKDAKLWPLFVGEWASQLKSRARPGDVVMVPDFDIAEAAGFEVLGAFLLTEEAWLPNIVTRTLPEVTRARVCYDSVMASSMVKFVCSSNEELDVLLAACCKGLV